MIVIAHAAAHTKKMNLRYSYSCFNVKSEFGLIFNSSMLQKSDENDHRPLQDPTIEKQISNGNLICIMYCICTMSCVLIILIPSEDKVSLLNACREGDFDRVRELTRNSNLTNVKWKHNWMPLHEACRCVVYKLNNMHNNYPLERSLCIPTLYTAIMNVLSGAHEPPKGGSWAPDIMNPCSVSCV